MINKNDYRKINDKKILHKSGKTWKVVSLALLLAIGGGATVAATNANANADATDNAYNNAAGVTTDTAAQAQSLEDNNYYGGSAKASVAPKSASKVTAAPSFANINYAPSEYYAGNNASAASYKNNESYDNANMNYYGPIVRGYIDQINNQYPQARSLQANYDNLQGKTNNARSAANSYSATAQDPNTANVISSMASKTNQTTSNYVDSVAYNVLHSDTNVNNMGFIPKVSYVANEASQDSVVASYANLIYDINNNPVLSAEYSAKANVAAANARVESAYASNAAKYVNQVNAQSEANNNRLNSNIDASIALSGQEEVAKLNSTGDSQFVSSAASAAGFKFNSSVVSSAVSAIASEVNSSNGSDYSITNDAISPEFAVEASNANANYFNTQVSVDSINATEGTVAFSASGHAPFTVSLGSTSSQYAAMNPADQNAVDFVTAVSDTATQSAYDNVISDMNKDISAEKANQTSYANELSDANDALNKANNSASAAASVAAADAVLGDHPNDNEIFNSGYQISTTSVASYNNDQTDSEASALNSFAGLTTKQFSGVDAKANASSAVKSAATKVSDAVSALINNLGAGQTLISASSNNVPNTIANYIGALKTSTRVTGDSAVVPGNSSHKKYSELDDAILDDIKTTYPGYKNAQNLANDINNVDITGLESAMNNLLASGTPVSNVTISGGSSNPLDKSHEVNYAIAMNIINCVANQSNKTTGNSTSNRVTISGSTVAPNSLKTNVDNVITQVKNDLQNAVADKTSSVNTTKYVPVYKNISSNDRKLLNDVHFNINNATYVNASQSTAVNTAVNAAKTALQGLKTTNDPIASDVTGAHVNVDASAPVYLAPILNSADYSDANNDLGNYLSTDGNFEFGDKSAASSVASNVASTAASAGSDYKSVSSASNSYAHATDQDVTIAAQFNSYYNSIANSDATLTASAKASLDTFRATHASNPEAYTSASDAYANAAAAKPNDRDFAYAYGKNVLLNTPEYITVIKNAMLHNDTQYAKSNSVESVKAGTQFAVKGVGFDLAGNVRYVVADHKGENLYLTANDEYVRNTYLAPSIDYTVTLAKPAVAHSTLGFIKDAKGTIPANTQLEGYTVPTSTSNNNRRDAAYGVTRLQVKGGKFNGDYITTNGKYFSNVTENNSNNAQANAQNVNPVQHTINFAD